MSYEMKELSLGGILEQAVNLITENFKEFFMVALYLYIPYQLLTIFINYQFKPSGGYQPGMEMTPELMTGFFSGLGMIAVLYLFVLPLSQAGLIIMISHRYLGRWMTPKEAMGSAFKYIIPLLVTHIIMGFIISLGFCFFIIPGLYLALAFFFAAQVVVIENIANLEALGRSRALMKGNFGKAFLLALLLIVVYLLAEVIYLLIPVDIIKMPARAVVSAILMIFFTAATVVFYFSCRRQKENFDLDMLSENVGVSPKSAGAQGDYYTGG